MPELPEVETTRRGVDPHVVGRRIVALELHEPRLRWRVPDSLPGEVAGQRRGRLKDDEQRNHMHQRDHIRPASTAAQ